MKSGCGGESINKLCVAEAHSPRPRVNFRAHALPETGSTLGRLRIGGAASLIMRSPDHSVIHPVVLGVTLFDAELAASAFVHISGTRRNAAAIHVRAPPMDPIRMRCRCPPSRIGHVPLGEHILVPGGDDSHRCEGIGASPMGRPQKSSAHPSKIVQDCCSRSSRGRQGSLWWRPCGGLFV